METFEFIGIPVKIRRLKRHQHHVVKQFDKPERSTQAVKMADEPYRKYDIERKMHRLQIIMNFKRGPDVSVAVSKY